MKVNKTKSAMTALVIAAMLCSAAMPIRAAEAQWVNNNGTWSYVKEDGSIAKGWIKDNDCWYAFDDNGAMRTGWIASNEHWYFMGESGVMQADAWVEDNGARYYIKGTGVMAKDYVKDGYELTVDGKAIPLAESKSVVLTDPEAIEGEVIEGNLYVDVTTAKALELKGVTVKGKLVVIGDNKTAGKLTITDSKIEAISTQTRNTEVVLSGETEVKTIVLEETAAVTPDKSFKGEVEKIEVQSTTKGEIVIEVPAQEVSTRTYASVDIQAPVESLEVKTDTQIKVNADVKNVVVTESAKDTAIEVSKGSTVGTLTADAPVKIEGSGTIEKVEANVDGVEAGKDTVIKEVEKSEEVEKAPEVNKPSTGGSSGGGSEPSITYYTVTFKDMDGNTIDTQTVEQGKLVTAPVAVAPDGMVFAAWFKGDKRYDLTKPVKENLVLTAQFGVLVDNEDTLKAAAAKGGNIVLKNDIQVNAKVQVSTSVNIFGDDHAIISNSNNSVISMGDDNSTELNNGTVGLYDITLKPTDKLNMESGIYICNVKGTHLIIDNTSIFASSYTLNIFDDASDMTVDITDSHIEGWAAIRSFSNNSDFTIERSYLVGTNIHRGYGNAYSTVVISGKHGYYSGNDYYINYIPGTLGQKNKLTFIDSTIEANIDPGSQPQKVLSLQYGANENNVKFINTKFINEGSYWILVQAPKKCNNSVSVNGSEVQTDDHWFYYTDASWYNENDSEFTINTPEELSGLSYLVNDKNIDLNGKTINISGDIDLENIEMNTIGYDVTKFNGTLKFTNGAGLVNFVADDSEQLLGFIECTTGKVLNLKINGNVITDESGNIINSIED